MFDVEEPTGKYKLNMSLPYSRMLVSELIALSEAKKGYEVSRALRGTYVRNMQYMEILLWKRKPNYSQNDVVLASIPIPILRNPHVTAE